jgi:hypothetical protein
MKYTPRSLGQALRISGITPADVTLIAVHLEKRLTRQSGVRAPAATNRAGARTA